MLLFERCIHLGKVFSSNLICSFEIPNKVAINKRIQFFFFSIQFKFFVIQLCYFPFIIVIIYLIVLHCLHLGNYGGTIWVKSIAMLLMDYHSFKHCKLKFRPIYFSTFLLVFSQKCCIIFFRGKKWDMVIVLI